VDLVELPQLSVEELLVTALAVLEVLAVLAVLAAERLAH
jgi:hypothetical protein